MMGRRWRRLWGRSGRGRHPLWAVPVLAVLALTVSARCSGDDAEPVTIFGVETDEEELRLEAVLADFTAATGIEVDVQGSDDFDREIGGRVAAGDAPDIAMFPQPGALRDFRNTVRPLAEGVASLVEENFDPFFVEGARFAGELRAVPVKVDLKSLVWYKPAVFEENGYEVPHSFEDFMALVDRMLADRNPPFCMGIEASEASGWPVTDWMEDWMLRLHGPEVYDRWWRHEIPFDDPAVVDVARALDRLWAREGAIYGGREAAAGTSVDVAGHPVLTGECMMYRYPSFYAIQWPDGTQVGPPDGDVSAFVLPGSADYPGVVLSGGMYAAAFSDDEGVDDVMEFLAGTEFAMASAARSTGDFLSPNRHVDQYGNQLARDFHEALMGAETVRYDASDLMPGSVGTGTFWTAAEDLMLGSTDVAEALAEVEATWPGEG